MEFENSFEVKAPVDDVWQALLDVERVAPCMPGAEVLERTGEDVYKVGIKVKVGPVSMQYRGDIEIVERDESAHRAVMRASAKETRGQGTANADVETRLSGNGATTSATIVTQLQVRGRAAAMGQGVMQDVAAKLVETFAANLGQMLSSAPAGATEAAGAAAGAAEPRPPQPPPPAAGELSALALAGGVIRDRLRDPRRRAKTIAFLALLLFWFRRRRRRRR
jgi:carbon monoxide dehydrogenase subunit G